MKVERDRDTLMGHTLEFKNNPEEDAPWVAQVIKRTGKKINIKLLLNKSIPNQTLNTPPVAFMGKNIQRFENSKKQ